MTPGEMDKKIEFILDMQAQFESNVGKLATNLAHCETNIDSLRISAAELAGVLSQSIKISDDRFTRLDDKLSKLVDAQRTADDHSSRLDDKLSKLVDAQRTADDHSSRLDERLNKLAKAHEAADERSARFDERMIELAAAQKTTDERLNTLISVVERHITGPDHAPQR